MAHVSLREVSSHRRQVIQPPTIPGARRDGVRLVPAIVCHAGARSRSLPENAVDTLAASLQTMAAAGFGERVLKNSCMRRTHIPKDLARRHGSARRRSKLVAFVPVGLPAVKGIPAFGRQSDIQLVGQGIAGAVKKMAHRNQRGSRVTAQNARKVSEPATPGKPGKVTYRSRNWRVRFSDHAAFDTSNETPGKFRDGVKSRRSVRRLDVVSPAEHPALYFMPERPPACRVRTEALATVSVLATLRRAQKAKAVRWHHRPTIQNNIVHGWRVTTEVVAAIADDVVHEVAVTGTHSERNDGVERALSQLASGRHAATVARHYDYPPVAAS